MHEQLIHTNRAALMQRLCELVRVGYSRYHTFTCPLEDVRRIGDTMRRLYDTDATRVQAFRARKAGHATARLFVYWSERAGRCKCYLMLTPGDISQAAIDANHKFLLVKEHKLKLDSFELFQMTKAGRATPVWTWRVEKEVVAALRELMRDYIAHKNKRELDMILRQIHAWPGFAGVRVDAKKLRDLYKAEHQRHKLKELLLELPKTVYYLRKIASKLVTVDECKALAAKTAIIDGQAAKDGVGK